MAHWGGQLQNKAKAGWIGKELKKCLPVHSPTALDAQRTDPDFIGYKPGALPSVRECVI